MSVGLFNGIECVSSFGSFPFIVLRGPGTTPEFAVQAPTDLPTWIGVWFNNPLRTDATTLFSSDGNFLALGGQTTPTIDGTCALFVDAGSPVVACVGHTTAPNVIEHRLAFFGAAPVAQPGVAGALSTVVDPPAKAVLTSIIAALVALGLVTDGTT